MKYDSRIPSVAYLARRARRRVPRFAMDYLEGGIGDEFGLRRNRQHLDEILLWPRYLRDMTTVNTECALFGRRYDLGIGIAPVGLGGLMWPNAEHSLATAAQNANIPYLFSTMSTTPLEQIARTAPAVAWYQLYVPKDQGVMRDLIKRVEGAGFKVLVITVDIPVGAKRDRELKHGLNLPFRLTPALFMQIILRPEWALRTLLNGAPRFVNLEPYVDAGKLKHLSEFLTTFFMCGMTPERLREIRALWQGPLVIKGLLHDADIAAAVQLGADGVIISNHAGRQLDAAPSSVQALRALPASLRENTTILLDSGIRSGLDVVRARVLGAQACFSGRSFMYGVAGAGPDGGRQVIEIFRDEITRTLKQIGCSAYQSLTQDWLISGPDSNFKNL
ncbi:MAG: alpha-hydroxy acid oxidase [Gammaproteobacteria bacterium]